MLITAHEIIATKNANNKGAITYSFAVKAASQANTTVPEKKAENVPVVPPVTPPQSNTDESTRPAQTETTVSAQEAIISDRNEIDYFKENLSLAYETALYFQNTPSDWAKLGLRGKVKTMLEEGENGKKLILTFNENGQMLSMEDVSKGIKTFTYTSGKLTKVTERKPNGAVSEIAVSRNNRGQMTSDNVTFEYAQNGKIVKSGFTTSRQRTLEFDEKTGLLVREIPEDSNGIETLYEYDVHGRCVKTTAWTWEDRNANIKRVQTCTYSHNDPFSTYNPKTDITKKECTCKFIYEHSESTVCPPEKSSYSYTYDDYGNWTLRSRTTKRSFVYHEAPDFAGSGTVGSPYQIGTAGQLAKLARLVNAGNVAYIDKYYVLTADINLDVVPYNTGTGWTPIRQFKGHFNGNNHKVSGLYLNLSYGNAGLFGSITGGMVRNLGVEGGLITTTRTNIMDYVGGLAGGLSGGSIINCYANVTISGNFDEAGCLVGCVADKSSVTNCYSTGAVSGRQRVGGLVGWLVGSKVTNCYTTAAVSGSVLGGLVGSGSIIENCVALNQSIRSTAGNNPSIWRVTGASNLPSTALVNNAGWSGVKILDGKTSEGAANNRNGADITTAQAKTQATYENMGWKFGANEGSPWKMDMGGSGYPVFYWYTPGPAKVTETTPAQEKQEPATGGSSSSVLPGVPMSECKAMVLAGAVAKVTYSNGDYETFDRNGNMTDEKKEGRATGQQYDYEFDQLGRIKSKVDKEEYRYRSSINYIYRGNDFLPYQRVISFSSEVEEAVTTETYTYTEKDSQGNWLKCTVQIKQVGSFTDWGTEEKINKTSSKQITRSITYHH